MTKRDPLQVSPQFRIKIMQLKRNIEKKENKNISIRELTERIANLNLIEDIEKKILTKIKVGDIKINFDGRKML